MPGIFAVDGKQDAAQILKALFQKGWLENTGEHFRVREPLAKLLGQMAKAETLVALYPGNPAREWTYLYPGEEIVAVQEVQQRKEAVRLFFIEKDQFQDFLREQGLTGEDDSWEALPIGIWKKYCRKRWITERNCRRIRGFPCWRYRWMQKPGKKQGKQGLRAWVFTECWWKRMPWMRRERLGRTGKASLCPGWKRL